MPDNGVIVVAALIGKDDRFLIGQRRRGSRHALQWEFPGGKVEDGETPAEALHRELVEELAIDAEIGAEVVRYEHCYPGRRPILLIFYHVPAFTGEPANLAFEQMKWESAERLPAYDFLDGDMDFVRRLARGEYSRTLGATGATAETPARTPDPAHG